MTGIHARLLLALLALFMANAASAVESVTSGPQTDYQASVIRSKTASIWPSCSTSSGRNRGASIWRASGSTWGRAFSFR